MMFERFAPYVISGGLFIGVLGLAGVPASLLIFLVAVTVCTALMVHVTLDLLRDARNRALQPRRRRSTQWPG